MVLPLAALGASAVSQLYQSATGQSANQANNRFQPPTTADGSTTHQTSTSSTKLNIPTKRSNDISNLLLSLQASTGSSAASSSPSAGSGTAASTTATNDPNSTLQTDLQNVLTDLQKAGGGHHHHHHGGGQPPNDASTTTGTDLPATSTAGASPSTGQSSPGSLFSQLRQALSAYAAQGASSSASLSTSLLTA